VILDVIRYVIIFGGLMTIGFNLQLFRHAADILKPWNITVWRWYLIGDTGFVIYVISTQYDALRDDAHAHWQTILAGAAMILTLTSLVILYTASRKRHQEIINAVQKRP
jgi:hypothetical protein